MDLTAKYQLLDQIATGGIETYHAREIATGRPVLLHRVTVAQSPDKQARLLRMVVDKLFAGGSRELILDFGEQAGVPCVVTADTPECRHLQSLLVTTAAPVSPASSVPPRAASPEPPLPAAPPAGPGSPQGPGLERGPFKIPVQPSEAPTIQMKVPASQSAAPAPAPAPSAEPGEFTRLFSASGAPGAKPLAESAPAGPIPVAPPSTPASLGSPPPPGADWKEPGDFTRMFSSHGEPAAGAPPQAPPGAPRAASPPPTPEPVAEPGEFTKLFVASESGHGPSGASVPRTPEPPPAPAAYPVQSSPEEVNWPEAPAGHIGEFTRLFSARGSGASQPAAETPPVSPLPPPSSAAPPASGPAPEMAQETSELVSSRTIGYWVRPSGKVVNQTPEAETGMPPPTGPMPPPPPEPSREPGEFTKVFSAQRIEPAAATPQPPTSVAQEPGAPAPVSQPLAQPPGKAPQTAPERGEFTRMFSAGPVDASPRTAPPSPQTAPPPAPEGQPGDFTLMFSGPQAVAVPPQAHPPERVAPPPPAPGGQPGEFTQMFSGPRQGAAPPQAPPPERAAPPPSQAGEFTKLFQSPQAGASGGLPPNAGLPGSGWPESDSLDEMLQRPSGSGMPSSSPGRQPGEFTKVFGGPAGAAQSGHGPGTPTPIAPASSSGATGLFQSPAGSPHAAEPGVQSGPSEYTKLFSSQSPVASSVPEPSHSAPAHAPEPEEPKSGISPLVVFLIALGVTAILLVVLVLVLR